MNKNKKQKNHLPVIGVGPMYVVSIITVTAIGIILTKLTIIPLLRIGFVLPFYIGGGLISICGIYLWYSAVVASHIDAKIKSNTLETGGIYAHVRNPIYSAFLFICSGVLLMYGNLCLLILPFLFWLYLTVFMKLTEEKWLTKLYGKAFEDYCKKVNRCIPSIRAANMNN